MEEYRKNEQEITQLEEKVKRLEERICRFAEATLVKDELIGELVKKLAEIDRELKPLKEKEERKRLAECTNKIGCDCYARTQI
jgi:hypothetical protein